MGSAVDLPCLRVEPFTTSSYRSCSNIVVCHWEAVEHLRIKLALDHGGDVWRLCVLLSVKYLVDLLECLPLCLHPAMVVKTLSVNGLHSWMRHFVTE